jgi:MFS family permease
LKHILAKKDNWIAAIYGGLTYAPTATLGAMFGAPFLIFVYGFKNTIAASIISFIYIGWGIGCPLFGWWSNTIARRKPAIIIGSFGALISLVCALYCPYATKLMLVILFFAFGFFSSGLIIAYSVARETNSTKYSATTLGFMNSINVLGGGIAPPLVGIIVDFLHKKDVISGIKVINYSKHFYIASAVLPIMMIIAILLIPLIKETFCKQINNE